MKNVSFVLYVVLVGCPLVAAAVAIALIFGVGCVFSFGLAG